MTTKIYLLVLFILFKLIFFGVILTEITKRPMSMADVKNQDFTILWLVSGVVGG